VIATPRKKISSESNASRECSGVRLGGGLLEDVAQGTSQPPLRRHQRRAQLRIGAGTDPQLECGEKGWAGHRRADRRDHLGQGVWSRLDLVGRRAQQLAVARANEDPAVHVIILQGAGRAFCSGYDLHRYAENGEDTQPPVWDPIRTSR
jgi:hypothetical protein